jgi:VanZ family protein
LKPARKKYVFHWLPVVALCLAIFIQSAFPSPDLGFSFPLKDKLLHMAVYGLLAALFYRACQLTLPGRFSPAQLLVISICFATLYGVSDEIHQFFVAARQAEVMDGVADFAGSVSGAVGYMKVAHR